jgi:short-subunit dehydrogenase involved in D-alanine esterification of teichoic acids
MSLTILITGGTSGLGRNASKKLFNLGHTVIITGRSQASLDAAEAFIKNENGTGKLYTALLVLDDFNSIKACVESVKGFVSSLDVILHNASMKNTKFTQFCDGKVEGTIFTNAIAPLYLNRLLMPLMEKSNSESKRILFVSSSMHDPELPIVPGKERTDIPKSLQLDDFMGDQNTWERSPFYNLSKVATIWDAFALSERYPQIAVVVFCPGFVPTTELNRTESKEFVHFVRNVATQFVPVVTEEQSAYEYVYYATDPEINHLGGSYFRYAKVADPSKDAINKQKRDAYWDFANEMIDIHLKRTQ